MRLPKFKNIKAARYIAGPSSFKKKIAKIVAIRGAVIFKVVNSGNFIFSSATNAVNGSGIFNIPLIIGG